ncbi:MAG: hypothetical protein ACTSQP_22620 [Promethearchaeota archaeon]
MLEIRIKSRLSELLPNDGASLSNPSILGFKLIHGSFDPFGNFYHGISHDFQGKFACEICGGLVWFKKSSINESKMDRLKKEFRR